MAEEDIAQIARERVARLVENWDWPEPQILEDIVALGEAAIPVIEDVLTPELQAETHTDNQAGATVYYLAEVLGAIGSPKAIALVTEMFRRVDDETLEGLTDIVQAFGSGAIDPLLSVVADGTLRWFPRTMAAEAAINLAGVDATRREQVAAGLRGALSDFLARTEPLSDEERDTVASIISDLSGLADPEARPLIDAAFEADIVNHRPKKDTRWDIPIISRDDVDYLYERGGSPPRPASYQFLERYPEDRRVHFEEEAKRQKNKALLRVFDEGLTETVVRGPRLGRNDPCWCGSGKKYKKCHLTEDEKAGR
jgi:hypothetical protein